jgi:PAS domain S-box-containing protein
LRNKFPQARLLAVRAFRDLPIRRKLVLIIMGITTAALLLSGIGLIVMDSFYFRSWLERDLGALGQIIADNSTAALAFNDPHAATETLAALRARAHIARACIYSLDGTTFARYARPGTLATCPPAEAGRVVRVTGDELLVSQPVLLSERRIGSLVLVYDLDEIAERRNIYGASILALLVASSLLSFLLSSKLQSVIAAPISQLVDATTSVRKTGDYGIRANKVGDDELGVLVDRFNEMLTTIESRDATLRSALRDRGAALREAEHARERFHFMAESMPQKIFTANPQGSVDYFNRQWTEFTGLSFEGSAWNWIDFVHPEDELPTLRAWSESIETGQTFHLQHRFRRADGIYRWHLSRALAMKRPDGNISMWIASSTEIHEQKEKEEELRRANDDLQQFAYSASHDLQEPIRNVVVYSEIISRRYGSLVDSDGQMFLGFLMEGGRRLAKLIQDLLAYTRAAAIPGDVAPVDSNVVLEQTLSSLAESIRETGAVVTYDRLPEVFMGEAHLHQLFQNLIGNALRYRTEAAPRVKVSAVALNGAWRFSIQDNGIGVDPQYKEKIFGVFKRLNHEHNGGTGIGLAICRRVVEIYGGRIWVESELGKGATFFFTIPWHTREVRASQTESAAG